MVSATAYEGRGGQATGGACAVEESKLISTIGSMEQPDGSTHAASANTLHRMPRSAQPAPQRSGPAHLVVWQKFGSQAQPLCAPLLKLGIQALWGGGGHYTQLSAWSACHVCRLQAAAAVSHARRMHCCYPSSSSSWLHRRPTGTCSICGASHISYSQLFKGQQGTDLLLHHLPHVCHAQPASHLRSAEHQWVGRNGHEQLRLNNPRCKAHALQRSRA